MAHRKRCFVARCIFLGTTLVSGVAVAERPGLYVGLDVEVKSDGALDGRANPSTNVLTYIPGVVTGGYAFGAVRLGAGVGYGMVIGDETIGQVLEVFVAPEIVGDLHRRVTLGLQLKAGYTHLDYDFKDENQTLDGVVVEPKARLAISLGRQETWSWELLAGWRVKKLFSEGDAQDGPAMSTGVRVTF